MRFIRQRHVISTLIVFQLYSIVVCCWMTGKTSTLLSQEQYHRRFHSYFDQSSPLMYQLPRQFQKGRCNTASSKIRRTETTMYLSERHESLALSSMRRRRTQFAGVSLSPTGFWVILKVIDDKITSNNNNSRGDNNRSVGDQNNNGNSINNRCYLPLLVTSNPLDNHAATSPESLTLLQLFGNIDMAGALLPPDVLSKLVVLSCEQSPSSSLSITPVAMDLLQAVHADLPTINTSNNDDSKRSDQVKAAKTYTELHAWFRSRMGLPISTLDEVWIQPTSASVAASHDNMISSATAKESTTDLLSGHDSTRHHEQQSFSNRFTFDWLFHIYVKEFGKLALRPSNELLSQVLYQHDDATSANFLAVALALRYKAPIVLLWQDEKESSNSTYTDSICLTQEELHRRFPMYTTVGNIQQKSTRVVNNIEQAYKVHQLQAILRLALQKNDLQAAAKIRAKLDEYDALDDLPVQDDSDYSSMQ